MNTPEAERLEALRRYQILDTPAEPAYDDITFVAAQVCGTPIALIGFVDANRVWLKSKIGLTASEFPRTQTTLSADVIVMATAPLVTADGHELGMLAVADNKPRELSPEQSRALQALSRQVMAQLELRRLLAQQTLPAATEEPPVDLDRLNSVSGGNPQEMHELAQMFVDQTADFLSKLRVAVQAGDVETVRRTAHTCAGSSAACGMVAIVPAMRELEQHGKAGDLADAGQLLADATDAFVKIKAFIENHGV